MHDLSELLSCRIQLKHAIVRFNCLPASYLHPMRRESFFPGLPDCVWSTSRAWMRLSKVILANVDFSEYFFDPNHWGWSIALLPPEKLKRIAQYSGAIALQDKVRSSLAREHVLAWKKMLGDEIYNFAMTSASLLPIANLYIADETEVAPERIGYSILNSVIESMPAPMANRCQLKIPPNAFGLEIEATKARRIVTTVSELSGARWFSSIE